MASNYCPLDGDAPAWRQACERLEHSKQTLAVEQSEAKLAARLRAEARKHGRTLHLPDALIAATAKENGLTLATRNVCDFDYLGVAVIDPWALDPSTQ